MQYNKLPTIALGLVAYFIGAYLLLFKENKYRFYYSGTVIAITGTFLIIRTALIFKGTPHKLWNAIKITSGTLCSTIGIRTIMVQNLDIYEIGIWICLPFLILTFLMIFFEP